MNSVYVPACIFVDIRLPNLKGSLLHTGIRCNIIFFKLSKTRQTNSIATGIEEKSLFNKLIWNNEMINEARYSRTRTSFRLFELIYIPRGLSPVTDFTQITSFLGNIAPTINTKHEMPNLQSRGKRRTFHSYTDITSFRCRCIVYSISNLQ